MSLKILALKNVLSNWAGLATNIAVGFFLSPFILHHLGDEAFGLWILIFSLTGYYGIFDFGIRSSLIRYVSKFQATGEKEQLARVVNTSLFVYSSIGAMLLLPTVLGQIYVDRFFHIPPSFLRDAQILVAMVGYSVALGFPLGISGGILEGLQKFYLINGTNIVATLVRAILIVYVLRRVWTAKCRPHHRGVASACVGSSSRDGAPAPGDSVRVEVCRLGFVQTGCQLWLGDLHDYRRTATSV